jgi:hypothetical protein
MTGAMGCALKPSVFHIVDRSDPNNVRRYQETFDEAYYAVDGYGNVNIVLRGRAAKREGETRDLTQVVHIRGVWRELPGRTVSDRTQLNAVVSYFAQTGRVGDSLEGTGSVFAQERKGTLTGTLDQAVLRPKRQLTPAPPLFHHAELSGDIHARRDPRQVVQIVNELERQFGPRPALLLQRSDPALAQGAWLRSE